MSTMSYGGVLVINKCCCGIRNWVPSELDSERRFDGENIYCPLGHAAVYKDSEKSELQTKLANEERRNARLVSRLDQTEAHLKHTEASRRATKGVLTKIRKRIANGVCPCCNRHFADVERH